MIQLEWSAVLLALPLPLLAHRLLPETRAQRMPALRAPFAGEFRLAAGAGGPATPRRTLLLAALAWTLLVLAAARPQWHGEPVQVPVPARDLMLAVDLSGSMDAADFRLDGRTVDRLTAAKTVARRFVARREGDRVGLILFGQQAFLQAPLTFDRTTVQALLDEAVIGLAGTRTAIGDAIGLAVKRLADSTAPARVLILMTDGANTAGSVEPIQAALLAAQAGLTVYTIGIGPHGQRVPSTFGAPRRNPAQHIDEATLEAVAGRTGGRYFRAHDTAELERIYGLLDELEPVAEPAPPLRPTTSLYPWPLAASLALGFGLLLARAGMRGAR